MGIDSLNSIYNNWLSPMKTSSNAGATGSPFGVSAFDGYFTGFNSYAPSFSNMDFMSFFMQQQPALMNMFMASPFGFNIGAPNFNIFTNNTPTQLRQKAAAMPLSKSCAGKLREISSRLQCDPKDLAAVIYTESGGNARAVNRQTGATGLIQFMPKTAAWLGTSTQALANMPAEQQLAYVEKYLATMKKRAGFGQNERIDSGTLYALVFMPAKAKQHIVCSGGKALSQNRGLAKNNVITKQTLSDKVRQFWHAAEKLFS